MKTLKTALKLTAATLALTAFIGFTLFVTMLNQWCGLLLAATGLSLVMTVGNAIIEAREDRAAMDAEDRAELDGQFRRIERALVTKGK